MPLPELPPRRAEGVRRYEGAQGGRLTAGWMSDASGPNTEMRGELSTLRDRSRDLVRIARADRDRATFSCEPFCDRAADPA